MVVVCAESAALASDPVQTDGDKYRVRFENEHVRVLEYRDLPGQKTQEHHHPRFVLFALSPFKRTITLPGGKVLTREFKAGDMLNPMPRRISARTSAIRRRTSS